MADHYAIPIAAVTPLTRRVRHYRNPMAVTALRDLINFIRLLLTYPVKV